VSREPVRCDLCTRIPVVCDSKKHDVWFCAVCWMTDADEIRVPCPKCTNGYVDDATCLNCEGHGDFLLPPGPQPTACKPKVHDAIKADPSTWARMERIGVGMGLDHRNCPCGSTMGLPVDEEVARAAA